MAKDGRLVVLAPRTTPQDARLARSPIPDLPTLLSVVLAVAVIGVGIGYVAGGDPLVSGCLAAATTAGIILGRHVARWAAARHRAQPKTLEVLDDADVEATARALDLASRAVHRVRETHTDITPGGIAATFTSFQTGLYATAGDTTAVMHPGSAEEVRSAANAIMEKAAHTLDQASNGWVLSHLPRIADTPADARAALMLSSGATRA